ncbi:MAG: hypothetical protein R3Y50_06010 [Rikenellaceae bacterium]
MIRVNGYVQFKKTTGGGRDPETGYPIQPKPCWSEPISCQWRAIAANLLAKSNTGSVTAFRYEIFVSIRDAERFSIKEHAIDDNGNEQFKLVDSKNRLKGEFSSKSIEYLDLIGDAKILT